MRFLYFYRVPLPDPRADAVQIVHTCAAMARAGAAVSLRVEKVEVALAGLLSYYGVEPLAANGGPMDVAAIGPRWSWPFLPLRTAGLLRSARGVPACLFVREVRPYVPPLMRRAKRAGLRVLFEAHNVSTQLVVEKRLRAAARHEEREVRRLRRKTEARASLERAILGLADGLIATQQATLDGLASLLPPQTPTLVRGNGTKLPMHPAADRPRDIDILYCGSLKPWKGVDTLARALGLLAPHALTIVGPGAPGDAARLRALARDAGADGRLTILPPVPPSEVWNLYARARVGVIPLPGSAFVEARTFTSPLKLFEMMAAGLPVVASRLPALAAYVEDGRQALLVPPDDPSSLAASIRRVLEDDDLHRALGAAARARAADFTWDARGRALASFAEEIWRRPARPLTSPA
jgi:glycosyltransferase involved in cell wall biosynthesis